MTTKKSNIPDIKGRKLNLPVFEKNFSFKATDLKVDNDSRTVSGYLAVFNNIDSDCDTLIKGCFAKSILERGPQSKTFRKIAFCWQHDIKDPIGRFTILKEDEYGLYFEAILDEGVPNADRALAQLKSGTLNQFSIGYMYVWDNCEWDMENQCLIVKEVNLFEGSVVTLGANELTYFDGLKSAQRTEVIDQIQELTEDFIKSLPSHMRYEARQVIAKNIQLGNLLRKDDDGDDDTDDPNVDFVNDAIENLQSGIDICETYVDTVDDDDVSESLKSMKASHSDLMDKMEAHQSDLSGSKSLKNRRPRQKAPEKVEPVAPSVDMKQLFNNLQIH